MGRCNTCVSGPYEGLWYIDYDFLHWYVNRTVKDECDDDHKLLGDMDYYELVSGDWVPDDVWSEDEVDTTLDYLTTRMTERYPSFSGCVEKHGHEVYIRNEGMAILENRLFWVVVEDNEWSLAIKLIQKEDPYDDRLLGLQKRHYERYLKALADILLEMFPEIGAYNGPYTHGILKAPKLVEGGSCA